MVRPSRRDAAVVVVGILVVVVLVGMVVFVVIVADAGTHRSCRWGCCRWQRWHGMLLRRRVVVSHGHLLLLLLLLLFALLPQGLTGLETLQGCSTTDFPHCGGRGGRGHWRLSRRNRRRKRSDGSSCWCWRCDRRQILLRWEGERTSTGTAVVHAGPLLVVTIVKGGRGRPGGTRTGRSSTRSTSNGGWSTAALLGPHLLPPLVEHGPPILLGRVATAVGGGIVPEGGVAETTASDAGHFVLAFGSISQLRNILVAQIKSTVILFFVVRFFDREEVLGG